MVDAANDARFNFARVVISSADQCYLTKVVWGLTFAMQRIKPKATAGVNLSVSCNKWLSGNCLAAK
jgi:hypothetical protein